MMSFIFAEGEEQPGCFVYVWSGTARVDDVVSRLGSCGGVRIVSAVTSVYGDHFVVGVTLLCEPDGSRAIEDRFTEILLAALSAGPPIVWIGDETGSPNPLVLRPGNSAGNVLAVGSQHDSQVLVLAGRGLEFLSDATLRVGWDWYGGYLDASDA